MKTQVREWVVYGPLEVEIGAEFDFKNDVWDSDVGTVLDFKSLCNQVATDLFDEPFADMDQSDKNRVEKIAGGLEELAQHHRFSDDAFEFARQVWLERGGE